MNKFIDDVLWAARPPLPFVEDRNVTEHARPWTATRGLHGREPFHGKDGWHVQGHGFDEVERQTLPVGKWPLVEVAVQRPVGIAHHRAVLGPGHALHALGIAQVGDEVEQELLPVPPADEVYLWALLLDPFGVERGKHTTERQPDVRIGGANLASEDLRIGVARGAQKAQADEAGLLVPDLFDDDVVGRFWVGLVEHHTLVPGAFEHRGEAHDADRRKAHDADAAVLRPARCRQCVELRVADVNQEYPHTKRLPSLSNGSIPLAALRSLASDRLAAGHTSDSDGGASVRGSGGGITSIRAGSSPAMLHRLTGRAPAHSRVAASYRSELASSGEWSQGLPRVSGTRPALYLRVDAKRKWRVWAACESVWNLRGCTSVAG